MDFRVYAIVKAETTVVDLFCFICFHGVCIFAPLYSIFELKFSLHMFLVIVFLP